MAKTRATHNMLWLSGGRFWINCVRLGDQPLAWHRLPSQSGRLQNPGAIVPWRSWTGLGPAASVGAVDQ